MRTIPLAFAFFPVAVLIGSCSQAVSGLDYDAGTTTQPDLRFGFSCGDGKCNGLETCGTCPADCGQCPDCSLAPKCGGPTDAPSQTTARADLDLPTAGAAPDGGTPAQSQYCKAPQLRMKVAKIQIKQGGGGQVYCVVNASDYVNSEFVITPKTQSLGNGAEYTFGPTEGIFWGQQGPHLTQNNMTITYNCFFVVNNSDWQNALMAAGSIAMTLGGVAGQDGWAFGTADVAAQTAAAALKAISGDQARLNVQQAIGKDVLLDLTNSRSWVVEQSKNGFDYALTIEAWGCADSKTK